MMADTDQLRDRIKGTVTMDDVLLRLGIDLPADRKIHSIYTDGDRTPSLHVYNEDFFDYSTGNGGDQIRFVQDYLKVSYRKALMWLAGMGDELKRPSKQRPPKEPKDMTTLFEQEPETATTSWQYDAAIDLFRKWPVTLEFAKLRYGVKVTRNELWIPHRHPETGRVVGIKTRALDTGKKRAIRGSTFTCGLYRDLGQTMANAPAILVEGESDTWSLKDKLGHAAEVYGLPSGASAWNDTFRSQLRRHGRVLLALDDDEAGRKAMDRITADLEAHGAATPWRLTLPEGRVAESLMAGWEPPL